MRARPRAAFVVTVSIAGSLLGSGCHKESAPQVDEPPTKSSASSSGCEPPDCHINPPPPLPTPTPSTAPNRPPSRNPPALPRDAGQLTK